VGRDARSTGGRDIDHPAFDDSSAGVEFGLGGQIEAKGSVRDFDCQAKIARARSLYSDKGIHVWTFFAQLADQLSVDELQSLLVPGSDCRHLHRFYSKLSAGPSKFLGVTK
jgi:hypothetical protein